MSRSRASRRTFLCHWGLGTATWACSLPCSHAADAAAAGLDEAFCVRPEELTLKRGPQSGPCRLSFAQFSGPPRAWRKTCRQKLAELLGLSPPAACPVSRLRAVEHEGVKIEALVMQVDPTLTIPAYLLRPKSTGQRQRAVMAIHGHGAVEPCIGLADDYHHRFALELAKAGHLVLCPALRGFGPLADLAFGSPLDCLDYWRSSRGRQFTAVTDAFLHGRTLIGETIEDLLRWEMWLAQSCGVRRVDAAGISYGGDVALTYPVFSRRVEKIYASGTLGSFSVVFARCYNAPAHCIPHVLQWMDRSDIAGLNAPRPIRLHYGALDTPGPHNNSASYNGTVEPALEQLRAIYRAWEAESQVSLYVSPNRGHEFDLDDLRKFLAAAEVPSHSTSPLPTS